MDTYVLMKIAYLECFSGISGDMFLGALLDAGVPPEVFTRTVEALGVDARLEISRVDRSGISATKLDVIAAGEKELPREEFWAGAISNQQSAVSKNPISRTCLRWFVTGDADCWLLLHRLLLQDQAA